jgi:hypothetical protein
VRLLLRPVGQGLDEAGGNSIRVEVAASPVKEVPFAEGRAVLLHEEREVGALPHGACPFVG